MTLKEAVESGKPFRRLRDHPGGFYRIQDGLLYWIREGFSDADVPLDWRDAIADDWETCE